MPTPAATALDNTDEHATTALYRAAIGEVNSAYYLPLFERFEAADRAGLSWNGAAALYTLNWLAFRQLWHAALVYAGGLVALALGVFGIGRLVFQLSDTTQWAWLGGLVLLSVLVPGLVGNAVLHAATRKRMEAALQSTTTVAEACTLLARKAPTRKGLIAQMLANGLALALIGYAVLRLEGWSPDPLPVALPDAARQVAVGRAVDGSVPLPAPAAAVASAPAPVASAPQAAASAPVAAASTPAASASAPLQATSAPPVVVAPVPAAPASAPAPRPAPVEAPPAPKVSTPGTTSAPRAAAQPRAAASAPRKIILLSRPEAGEVSSAIGGTATAPAARVPDTPTEPAAATAQRYTVLVGMFTLENNARNAYTQVNDAELPVRTQRVRTAQGTRFLVSSGPFETEAEAERAADKIRAMGLNARVALQ